MNWLAAIMGGGAVVLAGYAGLTQDLGAHPWWSWKVAWVGGLIGTVLFLVARRFGAGVKAMLLGLVGLAVAAYMAHWGKTEFAASFAENALAGKAWYYGWYVTCALAAATLAGMVSLVLPGRR